MCSTGVLGGCWSHVGSSQCFGENKEFDLSDAATEMFDDHPLWAELEDVDEWLTELSRTFDPSYEGLPGLANGIIRRIELVVDVTRLYLGMVPEELVGRPVLDELKRAVSSILVQLQTIKWDDEADYDEELAEANTAANDLLSTLHKMGFRPTQFLEQQQKADADERERVEAFLNRSQAAVERLEKEGERLSTVIAENKQASGEELDELRQLVHEVAAKFEDEIDDGVEAGKKRIDDQITMLQTQYNSEIEKQKSKASEELDTILEHIRSRKSDLDVLIENTQAVSGYVAEAAMSRMFRERAREAKTLWLGFTAAAGVVTLVSALLLYFAGQTALEDMATSADVIRGILRGILGVGAGVLATYLFRQASIQQRSFQDSRSAEARLGSLDAFLAPFEDEDAMEIRRGVGQRVYIDGELGEVARGSQASAAAKESRGQRGAAARQESVDSEERPDDALES